MRKKFILSWTDRFVFSNSLYDLVRAPRTYYGTDYTSVDFIVNKILSFFSQYFYLMEYYNRAKAHQQQNISKIPTYLAYFRSNYVFY